MNNVIENWNKFVAEWQYKECHGAEKYLHYQSQVNKFTGFAETLGLDKKTGMKTLDISAGMGFFAFVLQGFGHIARNTDRVCDKTLVYQEAHKALGLSPMINLHYAGNRFIPLPDEVGGVDMISAIAVAPMSVWTELEWTAFIADCRKHLNPDGFILLSPNTSPGRTALEAIVGAGKKCEKSGLLYYIVKGN